MSNRGYVESIIFLVTSALAFCGCLYERPLTQECPPSAIRRISIDNLFGQDLQYRISCQGHGGCTTFPEVSSNVPHLKWIRMYRRDGEILFYDATTGEIDNRDKLQFVAKDLSRFIEECEIDGVDVSVIRDEKRMEVGVNVSKGKGKFTGEKSGYIKPGVL